MLYYLILVNVVKCSDFVRCRSFYHDTYYILICTLILNEFNRNACTVLIDVFIYSMINALVCLLFEVTLSVYTLNTHKQ